jgi:uncharacterized protein
MFVPPMFADKLVDIPAFALLPAEIALVIMLSVLFFENATPPELLRLAFTMLALTMFLGGMGNVVGKTSQTLPDQTLLLNWVQLICMNIGGLITTIAFYQTRTPEPIARAVPIREVAPKPEAPVEKEEDKVAAAVGAEAGGESVADILAKLDVNRINNLEASINKPENGSMSLESLFADESSAASKGAVAEIGAGAGGLDDLLGGGSTAVKAPPVVDETPVAEPPKAGWATDVEMPASAPAEPEWQDHVSLTEAVPALDIEVPAPPPKEEPAAKAADGGKLFDDVSGDLEDIFADLAQGNANDDLTPEKLAEVKATAPVEEPKAEEPKGDSKLMDVSDDDIDDIFSSIIPDEADKQVTDMLEEIAPAAKGGGTEEAPPPVAPADGAAPKEVKEFGRLSAAATSKSEPVAPGTLKTIGQMLLDTQAVENIIKRSEAKGDKEVKQSAATAKVVSVSRGADIQSMLDKIAEHDNIDGALVIGKDGLLIGATQSLGMMRDVYGVLALGMHSTTNLGTKKIDLGELRQSILRTGEKVTIMTEIGIGVLAAFSDKWDVNKVDSMLDHIGKIIRESQASGGAELPMESLSGGLLGEDLPTAAEADVPAPPAVAEQPASAPAEPEPVAEEEGDQQVSITDMKGGLLNVGDDDLGDLFDNVLADPKVQHDAIGAEKAAAATDDMDDLFDDLLEKADEKIKESLEQDMDFSPSEPAAPAAEAAPAETPAEAKKEEPKEEKKEEAPAAPAPEKKPAPPTASGGKQIKEFGRLSTNTSAAQSESQGAIKAIGRQLIDIQAVENIIKSGEKREKMGHGLTTARVISQARGEGIKALLTKIDGCPGVAGSLIVGNDGLVIASTLTGGMDKDLLGALCNAMHSHTDLAAKKVQMGKVKQVIFHANDKMTILTAVAVGVLAVFVENHDLGQIDSLLTAIDATVRG